MSNYLYSHSSSYSIDLNNNKISINTPVCNDNCCYTIDYNSILNNSYNDLQEAFNTVVKKLLESKPELDTWIEKNFSKYLK